MFFEVNVLHGIYSHFVFIINIWDTVLSPSTLCTIKDMAVYISL